MLRNRSQLYGQFWPLAGGRYMYKEVQLGNTLLYTCTSTYFYQNGIPFIPHISRLSQGLIFAFVFSFGKHNLVFSLICVICFYPVFFV